MFFRCFFKKGMQRSDILDLHQVWLIQRLYQQILGLFVIVFKWFCFHYYFHSSSYAELPALKIGKKEHLDQWGQIWSWGISEKRKSWIGASWLFTQTMWKYLYRLLAIYCEHCQFVLCVSQVSSPLGNSCFMRYFIHAFLNLLHKCIYSV